MTDIHEIEAVEIGTDDVELLRRRLARERRARLEAEEIAESTTRTLYETVRQLERLVNERTTEIEARAEELTRSNAELEQFAYVASHDLQEPLRTVESYLALLIEQYGDKLGDEGAGYVKSAVMASDRMRMMISAMLDYSRVGSWAQPFELTNCNEVVDEAIANLEQSISESGALVECGRLPNVMADRFQLSQLFQNLIGNAIKFRREEPPVVKISADLDNSEWVFTVADNGIGVSPANARRIFDMFARLHAREEYDGTGIGLPISKKIIERHGGRIWVEPHEGDGATFHFTLPVKAPIHFAPAQHDD